MLMSSPTWGMWIEMRTPFYACGASTTSSPTWGMWIEIVWCAVEYGGYSVIPHMGDVD